MRGCSTMPATRSALADVTGSCLSMRNSRTKTACASKRSRWTPCWIRPRGAPGSRCCFSMPAATTHFACVSPRWPALARLPAPIGPFIAFATAPGTVADEGAGPNSPFTGALIKHIETPGFDVRQVMNRVRREVQAATNGRQIPWSTSVLEGDFYFRPPPTRQIAAPARPPTDSQTEIDVAVWKSVENTQDPRELQ